MVTSSQQIVVTTALNQQRRVTKNEIMLVYMAELRQRGLSEPYEVVCSHPCASGLDSDRQSFLNSTILTPAGSEEVC